MKRIELLISQTYISKIFDIYNELSAQDIWISAQGSDERQMVRIITGDADLQAFLDKIQPLLLRDKGASLAVESISVYLPKMSEQKEEDKATAARETLYEEIEKGANLDTNYILLVVLSTIVVTIGLIENNVAVVIGAMVIAPLLGPNLALSFGTALGDKSMMKNASITLIVGILVAFLLSWGIGSLLTFPLDTNELISRTHVNMATVALALVSGAAAALSFTSSASSVLVGVMVAVALLPPTSTIGLYLSHHNYVAAEHAALMLVINIICVNLASKLVFLWKGISPRTWFEKEKARRAMYPMILGWVVTLGLLIFSFVL